MLITHLQISLISGFYDKSTVRDMLKECSKMSEFNHPNVLRLIGVCLDGGPAPFIIMPFLMNGSLLAYLRKNRGALVVSCDNNNNDEVGVHPCNKNKLKDVAISLLCNDTHR